MEISNIFDLFINCYVYGSLTYLTIRLLVHLALSLLALADQSQETEPDFYNQVKELLNPSTEQVLEHDFTLMTIREIRTHIKEKQLHQHIRESVGKTVSKASKQELIEALS